MVDAESFESSLHCAADHLATVESPPLILDVYRDRELAETFDSSIADRIPALWEAFLERIREDGIPDIPGLNPVGQSWEVELTFVSDDTMRRINGQYRGKDEVTDVLSFTLLADSPVRDQLAVLPVVQLGSVFISPDWARRHTDGSEAALGHYMLERLVHGWLHLLGRHHDTIKDYEQVIAIQADVLNRI